jgi:NAD+ kinase
VTKPESITVFTRKRSEEIAGAVRRLVELAGENGATVRLPADEIEKHGLQDITGPVELGAAPDGPTDLAMVFGGDGTILGAMRRYAGREVPVFAVNFGAIGFLATVEREPLDEGLRRALDGDFHVVALPTLTVQTSSGERVAVNDVSFHRRAESRVAELGYSVEGEELGKVRCDGLVVSTPAGSTGYNLANGGPVMAWGVEGYVVSFIAPHTLTARALVVAPGDVLQVRNRSSDEPVDLTTDGRNVCSLEPEEEVEIRFREGTAQIAQVGGASFYHRLRDKFGRLSD